MASTLVQFRTDDAQKKSASDICKTMGIDLQDYLRLCMARLVSERGIPFSMNIDDINASKAKRAMRAASKAAENRGISEMTLEEINAEISAARSGR